MVRLSNQIVFCLCKLSTSIGTLPEESSEVLVKEYFGQPDNMDVDDLVDSDDDVVGYLR